MAVGVPRLVRIRSKCDRQLESPGLLTADRGLRKHRGMRTAEGNSQSSAWGGPQSVVRGNTAVRSPRLSFRLNEILPTRVRWENDGATGYRRASRPLGRTTTDR